MQNIRLSSLFLSLTAASCVLFLSGCPIWSGDEFIVGSVGDSCTDSVDCTFGLSCVAGVCEDTSRRDAGPVGDSSTGGNECSVDADCTTGDVCRSGSCSQSETCSRDQDCGAGRICDTTRNTCIIGTTGQCVNDSQCSGSQICRQNSCTDISESCQFDTQCPTGRSCVDGSCVRENCVAGSCGAGYECQSGTCVEKQPTECSSSNQCPGNEVCLRGICFAECTSDPECTHPEETCSSRGICEPEVDLIKICEQDSDCTNSAQGARCINYLCRNVCDDGQNSTCQLVDNQFPYCGPDMLCYANADSVPECEVSRDCSGSQECVNAQCE